MGNKAAKTKQNNDKMWSRINELSEQAGQYMNDAELQNGMKWRESNDKVEAIKSEILQILQDNHVDITKMSIVVDTDRLELTVYGYFQKMGKKYKNCNIAEGIIQLTIKYYNDEIQLKEGDMVLLSNGKYSGSMLRGMAAIYASENRRRHDKYQQFTPMSINLEEIKLYRVWEPSCAAWQSQSDNVGLIDCNAWHLIRCPKKSILTVLGNVAYPPNIQTVSRL